jgi:hypothetical protein
MTARFFDWSTAFGSRWRRFLKTIRETPGRSRNLDFFRSRTSPAAETPPAGREPLSSRHARTPCPRRWLRRPLHSVPCSQAAFRTGLSARGQARRLSADRAPGYVGNWHTMGTNIQQRRNRPRFLRRTRGSHRLERWAPSGSARWVHVPS